MLPFTNVIRDKGKKGCCIFNPTIQESKKKKVENCYNCCKTNLAEPLGKIFVTAEKCKQVIDKKRKTVKKCENSNKDFKGFGKYYR